MVTCDQWTRISRDGYCPQIFFYTLWCVVEYILIFIGDSWQLSRIRVCRGKVLSGQYCKTALLVLPMLLRSWWDVCVNTLPYRSTPKQITRFCLNVLLWTLERTCEIFHHSFRLASFNCFVWQHKHFLSVFYIPAKEFT